MKTAIWLLIAAAGILSSACSGANDDDTAEASGSTSSALGCIDCEDPNVSTPLHGAGGGSASSTTGGGRVDTVTIVGKKKAPKDYERKPPRTGEPAKDGLGGGATPDIKGNHLECPTNGPACQALCNSRGAPCNGASLHPSDPDGQGYGLLASCRTGIPTYACSYRHRNGELCSQVFIPGNIPVSPMVCTK